ncbi:GDSL esterase/lipase At5g08460 isoform X2 [Hevea brasiliensis]|uniref:GDSL esterase/lipase At5g08460 isoform X2 n=1 Tax=Hevea brasiliensis TaxID=3981 RepID=UPI0025DF22DA|nr:GDSL esterase/lipase At5g08460 isoform X2 [Hevea brasiliensis]
MVGKTTSRLLFLYLPILACFLPCSCYSSMVLSEENGGHDNEIKGMFVFGSSLVDNGNNNFLPNSMAKANYFPYGIDFPFGPSGRFTNGKNVIDLLGDQLHLPFIPAFADPSTRGIRMIHGVNYASGASGILDDTGLLAGEVISLNQQIRNFETVTLPELEAEMGMQSRELLKNYLFVVGTGGNDYTFNYFLKPSNESVSLEAFTANLTHSLSKQLKKLYNLGGRKFVLMSVNPIGCYPMVKAASNGRCNYALNKAAHLFNAHLKSLVDAIKPKMTGFKDTSNACCEVGSLREGGNGMLCKRDGTVCEERNSHLFFDGLHPTEAVNILIASKAYNSSFKTEAYPMNIKQLAMH